MGRQGGDPTRGRRREGAAFINAGNSKFVCWRGPSALGWGPRPVRGPQDPDGSRRAQPPVLSRRGSGSAEGTICWEHAHNLV